MFALAPVSRLKHQKTAALNAIKYSTGMLRDVTESFGVYELFKPGWTSSLMCKALFGLCELIQSDMQYVPINQFTNHETAGMINKRE